MFIIDDYNINDSLVDSLFALDENCPWMKVDFYRSLSKRKLQKNMWLYNELTNIIHDPNIMFKVNWLAPGFCYYSSIVLNKLNFTDIKFYDYDPSVKYINYQSTKLIKGANVEHIMLDVVFDREFVRKDPDLVVCLSTSSLGNRFSELNGNYYNNPLFALMGSNKCKRGNINVFESIDKFIESTGIKNVLYSGEKNIHGEIYYFVIGHKEDDGCCKL